MISWISSKLLAFMPIKGWLIGFFITLALANFATAKLLINEYKKSGKQSEQLAQAEIKRQLWVVAMAIKDEEIGQAQQRLVKRENTRAVINKQVAIQQRQVKEFNDENHVLDVDLGDPFWLHINKSVEAGNATYKLPDS